MGERGASKKRKGGKKRGAGLHLRVSKARRVLEVCLIHPSVLITQSAAEHVTVQSIHTDHAPPKRHICLVIGTLVNSRGILNVAVISVTFNKTRCNQTPTSSLLQRLRVMNFTINDFVSYVINCLADAMSIAKIVANLSL